MNDAETVREQAAYDAFMAATPNTPESDRLHAELGRIMQDNRMAEGHRERDARRKRGPTPQIGLGYCTLCGREQSWHSVTMAQPHQYAQPAPGEQS